MRRAALIRNLVLASVVGAAGCTTATLNVEDIVETETVQSDDTVTSAPEPSAYAALAKPRYGDRDPHEWVGRSPFNYAVHGTDVSKYQGDIDWRKKRRNGIAFTFIKATEGGDIFDEYFTRHWNGAKRAGIARGAYHFFYFCRPAFEQARWYIRNVPRDSSALPPVL
ncbi:MAG: GH25 family lysozyme, partial [Rhizobiaceae bacterium]